MSNRKPFNDRAGYVASRINSLTKISNVIYIAAEQGIDSDSKYATVCEAHNQMVSATSLPKARIDMKDASQWCEDCKALAYKLLEEKDGMNLVEVEPGTWGYVGEHVSPNSKDYENFSDSGYWIVTSGA